MFFQYLRKTEWNPTFTWVKTAEEAADSINKPHEDYPYYVKKTAQMIKVLSLHSKVPSHLFGNSVLLGVHRFVFHPEKKFAGKFRNVNVVVEQHAPPRNEDVNALMLQLEEAYKEQLTLEEMIEWYKDFETVHPFQDGNGRVGGIVVAAYSNLLHPEKGFYAAEQ